MFHSQGDETMTNKLAVAGPGSKFQLEGADPAGFWAGFWHGMMMPITFLVSLFNADVRIYESHNNGKAYDFGFVLGASAAFGGGTKSGHIKVNGDDQDKEDNV
jgi:hypothetical protein